MVYPALPDRRIPFDVDGTIVGSQGPSPYTFGIANILDLTERGELNDEDYVQVGSAFGNDGQEITHWFIWPELRVITGYFAAWNSNITDGSVHVEGSEDSNDGLDGTWEEASRPSGISSWVNADSWRLSVKPLSFTVPVAIVRLRATSPGGVRKLAVAHWYGQKDAGQTPDDIIFTDVGGTELALDLDYGVMPPETTDTMTFKIKNTSATLTATDIALDQVGTDWEISDDDVTYGNSLSVASLAPGASSGTLYARATTPAVGAGGLGPQWGRIVVTVDSWA